MMTHVCCIFICMYVIIVMMTRLNCSLELKMNKELKKKNMAPRVGSSDPMTAQLRDNWCWNERFPVPRGLAFNQSQLTRSLGQEKRIAFANLFLLTRKKRIAFANLFLLTRKKRIAFANLFAILANLFAILSSVDSVC